MHSEIQILIIKYGDIKASFPAIKSLQICKSFIVAKGFLMILITLLPLKRYLMSVQYLQPVPFDQKTTFLTFLPNMSKDQIPSFSLKMLDYKNRDEKYLLLHCSSLTDRLGLFPLRYLKSCFKYSNWGWKDYPTVLMSNLLCMRCTRKEIHLNKDQHYMLKDLH